MSRPHTRYEKILRHSGHQLIAGVDEVGRGAWAGPLVACAVIMPFKPRLRGVRDSKQLSAKKREVLAAKIKAVALAYAIGVVSHTEIDQMGITQANQEAMLRAINALSTKPDHVLVDAFTIFNLSVRHMAIPHGDATVYSIAAASIIAKVTRDAMMQELHKKYSLYGFDAHVGYGTKEHEQALQKHGLCAIHRLSFHPMRTMI